MIVFQLEIHIYYLNKYFNSGVFFIFTSLISTLLSLLLATVFNPSTDFSFWWLVSACPVVQKSTEEAPRSATNNGIFCFIQFLTLSCIPKIQWGFLGTQIFLLAQRRRKKQHAVSMPLSLLELSDSIRKFSKVIILKMRVWHSCCSLTDYFNGAETLFILIY